MHKTKALSLLLIISLMVSVLSACGFSNSKTSSASSGDRTKSSDSSTQSSSGSRKSTTTSNKITIKVSSSMTQANRIDLMKKTIAIYNKSHPNVKIDYSAINNYYQQLKLDFNSGDAADIVYLDDLNQQLYQKNNDLLDLTSAVEQRKWLDKQIKGSIEFNNLRTPGKYYSVPFLMAPVVMYYNKDIFSKLSLTPPSTLDEFNNDLAKIKSAGYTPMLNGGLNNYNLLWTVYQLVFGSVPMNDIKKWYYLQETTPTFKNGFIAALNQVNDWVKKGYYEKGMMSVDGSNLPTFFSAGKAAMMADGDWDLGTIAKTKVNAGIFTLPPKDPHLHAIVNATDGAWALNKKIDPKKVQDALDFIGTFMKPEVAKLWYEGGLTPTVKFDTAGEQVSNLKKDLNKSVANTQIGFYLDNTVPGLLDVMTKETQRMALQQITPEQCWENINVQYEKLKKDQLAKK